MCEIISITPYNLSLILDKAVQGVFSNDKDVIAKGLSLIEEHKKIPQN